MTRIFALLVLLLLAIQGAQAEARKFVQRAVLIPREPIDPEVWQEHLLKMLALARERCAASANDLLVVVEEVVPEENVETGIARREAVPAFLKSRAGAQVVVVVESRSRKPEHGLKWNGCSDGRG